MDMEIKGYRVQRGKRQIPTSSRVWVGEVYVQCRACHGMGEMSCADGTEICGVCDGRGEREDVRAGTSCCRTLEDLRAYLSGRSWTRKGCVVVEIEGREGPEEDWDADEGAVLLVEARIVRVLTLSQAGL